MQTFIYLFIFQEKKRDTVIFFMYLRWKKKNPKCTTHLREDAVSVLFLVCTECGSMRKT